MTTRSLLTIKTATTQTIAEDTMQKGNKKQIEIFEKLPNKTSISRRGKKKDTVNSNATENI